MALDFRVSFIWEDKDHFQLCSWVRLPLEWPKFPTYLQVSSVRKILDLFLFPTADVFLKCLWGQFLISSLRVFSYSDIPGLPGASELRTPQNSPCYFLPCKPPPVLRLWGPFPWDQCRGGWGLPAGDRGRLSPQSHGCEGSEYWFVLSMSVSTLSSNMRFFILPKLSASSWGKAGGDFMDAIRKLIHEVLVI